jgi:hypothetical protein
MKAASYLDAQCGRPECVPLVKQADCNGCASPSEGGVPSVPQKVASRSLLSSFGHSNISWSLTFGKRHLKKCAAEPRALTLGIVATLTILEGRRALEAEGRRAGTCRRWDRWSVPATEVAPQPGGECRGQQESKQCNGLIKSHNLPSLCQPSDCFLPLHIFASPPHSIANEHH